MTKQQPLREQLRNFLEQEKLDDRQYASIRDTMKKKGDEDRKINTRSRRKKWMIVAASVLILVTSTFLVSRLMHPAVADRDIAFQIAEEVATNHIKIRTLDLETSSMEQVQQFFDRLDFVPIYTSLANPDELVLKGGRYCTLQGKIAAHLIFGTRRGETVTYYQAAYDREKFGFLPSIEHNMEPMIIKRRGVEIKIWVENGVAMAQARTIAY